MSLSRHPLADAADCIDDWTEPRSADVDEAEVTGAGVDSGAVSVGWGQTPPWDFSKH
jgi:hypothetical protein